MRLDEKSFYVSPCYRIDDGMNMSYPASARLAVDAELGEPYIPEGPGWSKHAEPETPVVDPALADLEARLFVE